MYLNQFADTLEPLDMTTTAEFASLVESAGDLGISHASDVRYLSRHTVVRSLRFHFLEWGQPDAPPVVLLHGGNQSAHSWDLVSLHLSDRYHVYALDQRGHGDSEWTRDQDYTMKARAADALAFIGLEGLGNPIIVGHSMGGRVTMEMASSSPAVARGVVLVDVGPEVSAKGREIIQNFVARNVEFDDLDEFLDNVVKYDRFRSREHISRTIKYNMLRRVDGKYISKVDHRRLPNGDVAQPEFDPSCMPFPVLLIRGGESDVLEADAADRFVASLPSGQLVTVPNVGHNVHGGNTPGFLEAINPFLASL